MKIPDLETKRLIIRPYTPDDLESLFTFFNDEKVTRFTDLPSEQSLEETKEFLDLILQSYESEDPIFALAVARKADRKVIGSCGFAPIRDSGDIQIYYAFSTEYWGQGLATEASCKLLSYMFSELGIERAFVFASPENPASSAVAKKLGMNYKGTAELENKKGELFGIDKEEFLAGQPSGQGI